MASFAETFVAYMDPLTAVRGVFSAPLGGTPRVFDTFMQQGTTLPALTFQVLDDRDVVTFDGNHDEHPVAFQVDGWYANAAQRRAGSLVVREAMRRFRGLFAGLTVTRVFKDADFDGMEPADDGGPLPVFRNTQRHTALIVDPSLVS